MKMIIPACDGSGRYLVEVEADEADGPDVLHVVEPYEYLMPRTRLTRRERGMRPPRGDR